MLLLFLNVFCSTFVLMLAAVHGGTRDALEAGEPTLLGS